MTDQALLAVSLLLPCAGAAGVWLCGRWPNVRDGVTLSVATITAVWVWQLAGRVRAGATPELEVAQMLPGVSLAFRLEPLGALYALVASTLWIVTSLYAMGYMRGHHEKNQTRFFVCFALAIAASLGIAFSQNLLTLFLFYELLTFSTYPLVTHHQTTAARNAGRVYLGVLVSTSVAFLLLATAWTWHLTGTLEFKPGGILANKVSPELVPWLLALFAFGTGKAALMPFHRWLPAAMVAPTPVSALLHAVAVVKAGVFTILKVVVYTFGLDLLHPTGASTWLMVAASITIVLASCIAVAQDNLKARLAYSTISQLSYIVLGAAMATPAGILGGGLHVAMHAMAKITLFFCAGAIYVAAHKTRVSQLDGIGRRMPFTMIAFLLASLSLIGVPPFGGMWSKWHLVLGAAQTGHSAFLWVYMVSSLLSIAYLMPVVTRAFFRAPLEATAGATPAQTAPVHTGSPPGGQVALTYRIQEAPLCCVVPLCLTAAGSIVLFFFAESIYELLRPIVGG